jgi:LacI family transcriptional regulator
VSPEARARVLEAANTLGYLQQTRIITPPTISVATVGVLMKYNEDEPRINPFYSYVIAGIERECQRHNLSMMYATIEVDEEYRARSWPTMLLDRQVDGVLVVGAQFSRSISQIQQQAGKPVILVDGYATTHDYDSVVSDNVNGAFEAVSYLIRKGHQRIGLIGSHENAFPSILERREGYLKALANHGLSQTYIEDSRLQTDAAYDATVKLLRRCPELTAIYGVADLSAFGVMHAARDLGLDVPGDLSVIGFDDIDMSKTTHPPLTTIQIDKPLLGAFAVRLLIDRAADPLRPAVTVTISCRLIERESVKSLI